MSLTPLHVSELWFRYSSQALLPFGPSWPRHCLVLFFAAAIMLAIASVELLRVDIPFVLVLLSQACVSLPIKATFALLGALYRFTTHVAQ